jgi:hypothetical protein
MSLRAVLFERAQVPLGLAAAVVPFAICVHLLAEAVSLGRGEVGWAFVVRHLYLGAIFVATTAWFARTIGIGGASAERRRRCALIAAGLRAKNAGVGTTSFVLANLAFLSGTQLLEGVPIASGDWCLGFAAAILGSLASASLVFLFGRSLVAAALVVIGIAPRRTSAGTRPRRALPSIAPRCAAAMFSLSMPNRPPPIPSLG